MPIAYPYLIILSPIYIIQHLIYLMIPHFSSITHFPIHPLLSSIYLHSHYFIHKILHFYLFIFSSYFYLSKILSPQATSYSTSPSFICSLLLIEKLLLICYTFASISLSLTIEPRFIDTFSNYYLSKINFICLLSKSQQILDLYFLFTFVFHKIAFQDRFFISVKVQRFFSMRYFIVLKEIFYYF